MTNRLHRRNLLSYMGAGTAMGLAPAAGAATIAKAAFIHGVASGDPATDGAVIWTRATPNGAAKGDVPLNWFISATPGGKPLKTGKVTAKASADHTAKVEVTGLKPGTSYYYGFTTKGGDKSPVGQFRTLPKGKTDKVIIALASCQLYPGGYFNAYDDMARLDQLDAVLHLGDYIYEYGAKGYGSDIGKALGRLPDPPHDIVTLDDYRRRHAQMKSDPMLQAAHARAAFICVWDDHETANDAWVGGAENHSEKQGTWAARKAAALQAYFEWMPIRNPKSGGDPAAIYRAFEFGDLATLAMVETRLLARDQQTGFKGEIPDESSIGTLLKQRMDPARELLGAAQSAWLERVMASSVAAKKPWQLLGNQVVMARVAGPDLVAAVGEAAFADMIANMPEPYRVPVARSQSVYKAGVPFNTDAWDGYPPARQRLYAMLRKVGANPVAFAGDSHAGWANDLYDDAGILVGAEFGATAITSPSFGSLLPGLGAVIAAQNREVAFCDQDKKGYTLVTLTPAMATAEFITVSTVTSRDYTRAVAARYIKTTDKTAPLQAV
jgi:alkaline phosphatase D